MVISDTTRCCFLQKSQSWCLSTKFYIVKGFSCCLFFAFFFPKEKNNQTKAIYGRSKYFLGSIFVSIIEHCNKRLTELRIACNQKMEGRRRTHPYYVFKMTQLSHHSNSKLGFRFPHNGQLTVKTENKDLSQENQGVLTPCQHRALFCPT